MSRKHFKSIAEALNGELEASKSNAAAHAAVVSTIKSLASVLAGFNLGFDRSKFLRASGLQGE